MRTRGVATLGATIAGVGLGVLAAFVLPASGHARVTRPQDRGQVTVRGASSQRLSYVACIGNSTFNLKPDPFYRNGLLGIALNFTAKNNAGWFDARQIWISIGQLTPKRLARIDLATTRAYLIEVQVKNRGTTRYQDYDAGGARYHNGHWSTTPLAGNTGSLSFTGGYSDGTLKATLVNLADPSARRLSITAHWTCPVLYH